MSALRGEPLRDSGGAMIRATGTSPRTKARVAGAFYLLTIVLGGVGESISGRLIIAGDPAATASAIMSHVPLLRWAFAAYMVEMAASIVMTAILYELLAPVSRTLSLMAAFFSLVGTAIKTLSRLFLVTPLILLGAAPWLSAWGLGQRQVLALVFLRVNAQGAGMALIFLGIYTLLASVLVLRSTFLPRVLGVIGIAGGLGWLTFLYPPLADRAFPIVVTIALVGAVAKIGWLLVVGLDEQRWREQAAASSWSR